MKSSQEPRGHIVIVLTSLRAEGTPRLALDLCRQWLALGVTSSLVVLFAAPDDLAAEFSALDARITIVGWPRAGYGRYARLVRAVARECRRTGADAVVSMPLGWHLFAATGARLAGVSRVLAHVGNYVTPDTGRNSPKFAAEIQLARPFTTRLVCCSHYVRDSVLAAFRVRSGETAVIYNGVNLERFSGIAAARPLVGETPIRLGMVATLEAHKDQATLIAALAQLNAGATSFELALVGEGGRRGALADLAARLGVADAVDLLGSRRDIPEILGGLDIYVFSTTIYEGQGIALVEAMAAGLPIVASDVGACREVLDGGRCGVLVPPGDPVAMADAIAALAADAERSAALGRAAAMRARETFGIETTARRYAELCGLAVA